MSTQLSRVSAVFSGVVSAIGGLAGSDMQSDIRGRNERLLKLLLVAPFMFGALAIVTFAESVPAGLLLSATCTMFALPWLMAGLVLSTRNFAAAEKGTFAFCTLAITGGVMAAGGLASPLLLLVFAIPAETYWVSRNLKFTAAGLLAALVAAAAQLTSVPSVTVIDASHWVVPFAYLATLAWRLGPFITSHAAIGRSEADNSAAFIDSINAVVLEFGEGRDVKCASPQSRQLLNVDGAYLLGNGLFERVHVSDRVLLMAALSDIRAGAVHKEVFLRLRVPAIETGEADHFEEFACEFVPSRQNPLHAKAIIRSNAEVQNLRAQLRDLGEKTAATEIAKSRFLATVSHELRTPLNAIIGFSDILLYEMYGKFSDERQREYVDLIRQSGNHLLSVVNAVLDVSKIESGTYAINPDTFDFKNAVTMCRSMLEHQANAKNIALIDSVSEGLPDIMADARAVQQILINLVTNALKFTPDGGMVTISANLQGDYLRFEISDTGIGIEHEDIERLGNPFVQVQNDYTRGFEGTGLGLSLVKGLVELHEGSMSIDSEPGEGTVVSIAIPIAGPSASRENKPAGKQNEDQQKVTDDGAEERLSA